jgi:hypothetical protein
MSDFAKLDMGGTHNCEVEFWPSQKKPREIYIRFDGQRIARRGHPDTPEAKTWVPLDARYRVRDEAGGIAVEGGFES